MAGKKPFPMPKINPKPSLDPSPAKTGKGAGKAYPGIHQQTHVDK